MKSLQFRRSVPGYLAVRALQRAWSGVCTSVVSPLRLVDLVEPALPGQDWVRVHPRLAGICGSDLATITGSGSPYFSAVTSLPFVFGHEVVGLIGVCGSAVTDLQPGERVIIEPALGCKVRGIAPPCRPCANGHTGNCENVTGGAIAAGIQCGYCRSTGGAWSHSMVAHRSQIHRVPAALTDEDAVMIEPLACALHAAYRSGVADGDRVLVIGAGSVGLLTLVAIRQVAPRALIWVAARHKHQAQYARELGATEVIAAGDGMRNAVLARTGAKQYQPELGPSMVVGGVDVTFDCVGSSATVDEAVRLTRSRGRVVVVGMPGRLDRLDGAALWYQETNLIGSYAYGVESTAAGDQRTFALAIACALVSPGRLGRLVTGRFALHDYRKAIACALSPSRNAGIKTVFDLSLG